MLDNNNKVNYVEYETAITAKNMNDIQESILKNQEEIKANASQLEHIANDSVVDLSLIGTKLKLKKSDGNTIGIGVTLPTGTSGLLNNSVKTLNIKDKSVTADKTNFVTIGKNKFDKNSALDDTSIDASGNVYNSVGSVLSDYIKVDGGIVVAMSHENRIIANYDENYNFISRISLGANKTYVIDEGCSYIRVIIVHNTKNTFQLEFNDVPTLYEDYILTFVGGVDASKFKNNTLNGNVLLDSTIEKEKVDFIKFSKNLFNKNDVILDKSIWEDGSLHDYDSCTTNFINVKPGMKLITSHKINWLVTYDINKKRVGSLRPSDDKFIIPDDVFYVRFFTAKNRLNDFMLEEGEVKTEYEEFSATILPKTKIKLDYHTIKNENYSLSAKESKHQKNIKDLKIIGHTICEFADIDDPNLLSWCHPSVVYNESGWNGYKYWMGVTAYPQSAEEIFVFCSNDGITWTYPRGIKNPIYSLQDAKNDGYNMTSDTHIIFSKDGSKLMLYFRAMYGKGEGLFLAESENGSDWSIKKDLITIPFKVIDGKNVYEWMMSPSIIIEDDNTFKMFSVNHSNSIENIVDIRTSPDGISWSDSTKTNIPLKDNFIVYHIDIKKYEGIYYMLALSRGNLRLAFLTSPNGIDWEWNDKLGIIPLSGFAWDKNQHYRSCFMRNKNGKFDLWINGVMCRTGNAWAKDTDMRIAYYKDVDIENGIFPIVNPCKVYYGTLDNSPNGIDGYNDGDRYEFTNPVDFIGKILVKGSWKNFGKIEV